MADPVVTDVGTSARKIDREDPNGGCPVVQGADGVWRISGYAAGQAVLRSLETKQAGLGIDASKAIPKRIRRPVLHSDGPEHRERRRLTARFFTLRRVDEHYRELMHRVADEQIDRLRRERSVDLSELSFALAVEVAAAVIGLTNSRPGMAARLERFAQGDLGPPNVTSIRGIRQFIRQNRHALAFYLADVRPAVRARRRRRTDDLISHMIDQGCTNAEIFAECVTFAPAGMITTREFINVAAWHLFTDDTLRARYHDADQTERIAILHEFLRLEPVISTLKRRTTADIQLPGPHGPLTIPAGAQIDIAVSSTNIDTQAIGADPYTVRPARPIGDGVSPAGLSFGDGPHKCPGAHVAIHETDIFLHKLFMLDGLHMASPPQVTLRDEIAAYELRGLVVTLD
ncbi:cytochrome P450 [Frankia casuarinae]|uniref:Cytochrome P450 n=2 Tax=Frankia casuarinae (strain DSM 45818 / CECT 9043 / HFP020203 / CcI3) TaxID=106370 RepID=Q2JBK2_FRACC|nr:MULTISPECIES: cytochrome P450 [Frankia]ABD11340.1 cytochrome P450 [Frankia casuarinae]ETA01576.1 cytochrome P450 [Frankia sp. CcI6]EYT89633.1 cytochrome P450 [Frankia casuarinae]KDA42627.1 cytochrome P450 [Frankia sp. BMG5.23]KFB04593.1 cytochrome P450 [Frankia sp. Allo2]